MYEPSKTKKDTPKKRIHTIHELTNIEEGVLTNSSAWIQFSYQHDNNHIEYNDYGLNWDPKDQGIIEKAAFFVLSVTIISILCYVVFNEIVFVVVSGFLSAITLTLMNVFRQSHKITFDNYEKHDFNELFEECNTLDQIEKIK